MKLIEKKDTELADIERQIKEEEDAYALMQTKEKAWADKELELKRRRDALNKLKAVNQPQPNVQTQQTLPKANAPSVAQQTAPAPQKNVQITDPPQSQQNDS